MLTNVMEVLSRRESLSLTQLADVVGYSTKELEGALAQLEHMGYIHREALGEICNTSYCSGNCEGCGFLPSKKISYWILTERGKAFLSGQQSS